jgi:hypothetical protein
MFYNVPQLFTNEKHHKQTESVIFGKGSQIPVS